MTARRSLSTAVQSFGQSLLAHDAAGLTDAELVCRFSERRDEAAFAALVSRYGPLVFGVCRRVLRHQQDAEDAFQTAFVVFARNAARVQRSDAIGNWLYGVAFNVARKAKSQRQKRDLKERAAAARRPEIQCDPSPDLRELLDVELHALSPHYREAIVLCDLQGLSRQEAATAVGCSPKALGTRLDRGRAILGQRLTRRGFALTTAVVASFWTAETSAAVPASLASSTCTAATGGTALPPSLERLLPGASQTMLKKSIIAVVAMGTGLVLVAGLAHGPAYFAAHASSGSGRTSESQRTERSTPSNPFEAIHNLMFALHQRFFTSTDKKDEKPAASGTWEKKDGEMKLEFAGKDELKISPHGKDDLILLLCSYSIDKDGIVKGKVTGFEGKPEIQEKLKEKIPVGTEFSFTWKLKDGSGTLDEVKGEKFEMFKSHLEGTFTKK